jgi:class 3 adenylate cyclase
MARLQIKCLDQPDEIRSIGAGSVRLVEFDDVTIGRAICAPGWRWSEHVRPLVATSSCQAHHRGYLVSGRFAVRMDDGGYAEVGPGDAFDIPPGHDSWTIGDEAAVSLEYSGIRGFALPPAGASGRRLLAIAFIDIVDSTAHVQRLGDAAWSELLGAFREQVEERLEGLGGRLVDDAGDGFLAAFESPAGALRATRSIVSDGAALGLALRCGVHTGEVDVVGAHLRGAAVHAGARIMQLARPGEILASSTTVDLVSGSGFLFEARGVHVLRGLVGARELFALVRDDA